MTDEKTMKYNLTFLDSDGKLQTKKFSTYLQISHFLQVTETTIRNMAKGRTNNYRKSKKTCIFFPKINKIEGA